MNGGGDRGRTADEATVRDRAAAALARQASGHRGVPCLFGAGFVQFHDYAPSPWGLPVPVVAGTAYVQVALPMLFVVGLLLPSCRFVVEILGVVALGVAVWSGTDPAVGLDMVARGEGRSVVVGAVLLFLVAGLYATGATDRLRLRSGRTRARARSPLTAQAVWDALIGSPRGPLPISPLETYLSLDLVEPAPLPGSSSPRPPTASRCGWRS